MRMWAWLFRICITGFWIRYKTAWTGKGNYGMKNIALLFGLPLLLFSCASVPRPAQGAGIPVQSSSPGNLDAAVREGAEYLAEKIPPRAKIAFASMQSPTDNLSAYIVDTAIMHLANKNIFTVVERSELVVLQKERNYQLSGEVSDETAVSIGHQLGAEVIISGSLMEAGGFYSLRLKVLDVKTAQILGTRMYRIGQDRTLTALLTPTAPGPVKTEQPQQTPPQTVINGDINITNNNNTTINGDVYINKPNWFDPESW
jgi:TolB-like protein